MRAGGEVESCRTIFGRLVYEVGEIRIVIRQLRFVSVMQILIEDSKIEVTLATLLLSPVLQEI